MAQNKLPRPISELLDLGTRTLEIISEAANEAGAGKASTLALG